MKKCIKKIVNNLSNKNNKIRKFKNKHLGERCFIIGNGPSLRLEDLEKLKEEITFGSNKIYTAFEQTDWRPTYYCIQDGVMLHENFDEINDMGIEYKFISDNERKKYGRQIDGAIEFYLNTQKYYPKLPRFSEDPSIEICEGFTVTYGAMQLAVYMGFKEIYLLGIDFNYSSTINQKNEDVSKNDYFMEGYVNKFERRNMPNLDNSLLAYLAASNYAIDNGIKIYNATRGGKLEVFERVSFDEIVKR